MYLQEMLRPWPDSWKTAFYSPDNNNPAVLRDFHSGPGQLSLDGDSSGNRLLIQPHILITGGLTQNREANPGAAEGL